MIEELKDLVTSKAWEHVVKHLEERRNRYLHELTSNDDYIKLRKFQSALKELDYVIRLPHELLKER